MIHNRKLVSLQKELIEYQGRPKSKKRVTSKTRTAAEKVVRNVAGTDLYKIVKCLDENNWDKYVEWVCNRVGPKEFEGMPADILADATAVWIQRYKDEVSLCFLMFSFVFPYVLCPPFFSYSH